VNESEIKREICEFLDTFSDILIFTVTQPKRTKYTSKFMRRGWPDIYGSLRGRGFFIEIKTPEGTLSLEQHKLLETAKMQGNITCVATSIHDVKLALKL